MQIPIPEIVMTWQFWIVAVAVFILCEIFKQIPYLKEGANSWLVNLFGILVGIILLCLLLGWTVENCIFGILAAAASTLAYEIWQNILNQVTSKGIPAQNVAIKDADDTKVGGSD